MGRSVGGCMAVLLVLGLLAGCERQDGRQGEARPPEPSPAGKPVLLIGLIPEQNIFKQMERYEPLARHIEARTGTEIRLKVLLRYGNIIDNFVAEGLDGAFFGSFTYTLAHEKLGVQVVARPEGMDGRSTYFGMLLVRQDSGIRSAADMRGKRFVYVDKATTAGYLLPLAYFRAQGIDHRTHLREQYFAGTHEDAILDILDRRADIGAAKNTVFERMSRENVRISRELKVLERSPDVPENALALRKGLDPRLVTRIRKALLSMHEESEGREALKTLGARRFIPTADTDYRAVHRYVREAGIDLAVYDYLND